LKSEELNNWLKKKRGNPRVGSMDLGRKEEVLLDLKGVITRGSKRGVVGEGLERNTLKVERGQGYNVTQ